MYNHAKEIKKMPNKIVKEKCKKNSWDFETEGVLSNKVCLKFENVHIYNEILLDVRYG